MLAGCVGFDPPQLPPAIPQDGREDTDVLVLTTFFRGNDDSGAPGNTMAPRAHRDGARLVAAVDNYWDRSIYLGYFENGTVVQERLHTDLQGIDYAEQMAVAAHRNTTYVVYRVGLDRLVLQARDGTDWHRFTLSAASRPTLLPDAVVSVPAFAASSSQLLLGHGVHGAEGVRYRVLNLTDAVGPDGFGYMSKELATQRPVPLGDLDLFRDRMGVVYPRDIADLVFFEAGFDEDWTGDGTTIYTSTTEEALFGEQTSAIVYDADGGPYVVRAFFPWVGDDPMSGDSSYQIHLAKGPEWRWTDIGVATMDFPDASMSRDGLLFTVRTDPAVYTVLRWDGVSAPATVMTASCKIRLVANSTAPEAVALAFDDDQREYRLLYVPDVTAMGDQDPCQGTTDEPSGGAAIGIPGRLPFGDSLLVCEAPNCLRGPRPSDALRPE